ncbi:MAG: carbon-nitrogen hydrolase family protein [Promethearchaeota archaeon]
MKVACIQPRIHQNIEKCYAEIEYLLKNLLEEFNNCDIVCLPERWSPFISEIPQNFQEERGESYEFIKGLAKKYEISLLSGAIWEKRENKEKPFITCYYFNAKGEEIGKQDKIHLYSYEKDYFEPGLVLNIFKLGESKFAILICFDMVFFESPRLAIENGADVLISPTQIREDGMENWYVYLKARALENRVPIVACNTFGNYLNRKFIGNSKIISFIKGHISPSKLKIIEGPKNSSGFIFDEIDLDFPKKIRKIRLDEKIEMDKIKINIINE